MIKKYNMKNIFKICTMAVFVLAITGYAFAAQNVKEVSISGIKVIYKKTPKDVISVRMFVKGGNANISEEKQGLENFAFGLATAGGAGERSADEFATTCEILGTRVSGSSTYDYGSINMTCIKANWDKSFELFRDVVMSPGFDENEYGILKEQLIAAAKQEESDPDQHLVNIAMDNVFKGRSYSKIPNGTAETLSSITLEDIKSHFNAAVCKKRVFLVVVGNVDENDLVSKIGEAFGKMKDGTASKSESRVQITKPSVVIEDRDIATNYILGIMSAPNMATEEGIAMRIGMNILRDRYFVELRTKRSLSYAPQAGYNTSRISNPYNSIYISTLDPKQSIDVMVEEINKIKKDGFTEKELSDKKQTFLTRYFMGEETSSAQAATLGLFELAGDWQRAISFTEDVNKADLKLVNNTFTKYTGAIRWTYLGKEDAVEEDDFKQTWEGNVLQSPY
jgi:predicted Zn-dependent peptidase